MPAIGTVSFFAISALVPDISKLLLGKFKNNRRFGSGFPAFMPKRRRHRIAYSLWPRLAIVA
jgi:hypothetical protein